MKTVKLLLTLVFGVFVIHAPAQYIPEPDRKNKYANAKWNEVQSGYNYMPVAQLQIAEQLLDSTINSPACFKYIHNADTTKCFAFFIQLKSDPSFQRITRFGNGSQVYYKGNTPCPAEYYAYTVVGMVYKGQWYYDKINQTQFCESTDLSAQLKYLNYSLNNIEYLTKTKLDYWDVGGVQEYFVAEPDTPRVVKNAVFDTKWRDRKVKNSAIEELLCPIQSDLWDELHQSDPAHYKTQYTGLSDCLLLYNKDHNQALLPVLYYDDKKQGWLSYYYVRLTPKGIALYRWKKIEKRMVHDDYDDTVVIADDVRSFIQLWSWGTGSMVSNDKFWENFTDADIEFVKSIAAE